MKLDSSALESFEVFVTSQPFSDEFSDHAPLPIGLFLHFLVAIFALPRLPYCDEALSHQSARETGLAYPMVAFVIS